MKKTLKRIIACVVTILSIFTFSTTAFAAAEELTHSGYSTSGYYTSQSVPQKNDTQLKCLSYETTGDIKVFACYHNGSNYIALSASKVLTDKPTLVLSTSSIVRHVKLRVYNYGNSVGVRTYSAGHWRLYA